MATTATIEPTARPGESETARRIVFNPKILGGKPIIRGTRITVEFVLELLAAGGSIATIIDSYPHLAPDDVKDAILFAAANLKNDIFLAADLP